MPNETTNDTGGVIMAIYLFYYNLNTVFINFHRLRSSCSVFQNAYHFFFNEGFHCFQ